MILNIIYTRYSVRWFILFIDSLVNRTTGRFRLVSNGCSPEEQKHLAALCRRQERLAFFSIPTHSGWPHGKALNYLQARTQDKYFCFMDSDIFAVEDFVADIKTNIGNRTGLFSGTPLWAKSEEIVFKKGFKFLLGRYNQTDQGLVLGNTYVAVYDNEVLSNVIRATGIGFEARRWRDIPFNIQLNLETLGMKVENYDTGKLLNLILLNRGGCLMNMELSSIYHIGGGSFQDFSHEEKKNLGYIHMEKLRHRYFQRMVRRLTYYRIYRFFRKKYKNASRQELDLNFGLRFYRRNPVRRYFFSLLDAMAHQKPWPEMVTTGDDEIDDKLKLAQTHLMDLFCP